MSETKQSKLPHQKASYQKSVSKVLKKAQNKPSIAGKSEKGTYLWEILAFVLPFLFIGIGFYIAEMHPFGDRQFLVTDLWHQYYPFFQLLHEKLQNFDSLLYSWRTGMGTNFLSLMAYYAASPLNFLAIVVPAEWLREALMVILMLKFSFAGLFFAKFLRYTFGKNDISICMFGVMYALCSYMMGYYWNVIWIDTVALLPLVMLGLVQLVRERRYRTYVFALALALMSNYYIAYFICIFAVLAFLCLSWYQSSDVLKRIRNREWKSLRRGFLHWLQSCWLFPVCSILGAALFGWILLPAYHALQLTHSASNDFPSSVTYYEGWREIVSNMLAFTEPTSKEGLPNLYCGLLPVLLLGVFLFARNIRIREKITAVVLMVFLIVSCNMNVLNFIWHGFHFTNMLPYRFSFLFSFVVLVAAYRAYRILLEEKLKAVHWASMLLTGVLLCMVAYSSRHEDNKLLLILTAVLLGVYIVVMIVSHFLSKALAQRILSFVIMGISAASIVTILCLHRFGGFASTEEDTYKFILSSALLGAVYMVAVFCRTFATRQTVQFLLAAILIFEMGTQAINGVKAVGSSGYNGYPSNNTDVQKLLDEAESTESDLFYRTELSMWYTLNDPSLYYYDGISQFSSMANENTTTFLRLLGLPASEAGNRYYYANTSPFTNMLLNIRYMIAKDGYNADTLTMTEMLKSGSCKLYQNQYYLPIGFMVEERAGSYHPGVDTNPFVSQNALFRRLTGLTDELFTQIDITHVGHKGYDVTRSAYGTYSYTRQEDAIEGDSYLKYNYTAIDDGMVYAYMKVKNGDNMDVYQNNNKIHSYNIGRQPYISPVADCQKGEMITLRCNLDEEAKNGTVNVFFYQLNEEVLQAGYDLLADEVLRLENFDDTSFKGEITANKNGYLYLSVPYEEGWAVYVDGKKAELVSLFDAVCGVYLEEGTHIVEMKYSPKGFVPGVFLSVGGLLLIIILWTLEKRGIKLRAVPVGTDENEKEKEKENKNENKSETSDEKEKQ